MATPPPPGPQQPQGPYPPPGQPQPQYPHPYPHQAAPRQPWGQPWGQAYPGYPVYQPPPSTNGFAIAALVLSLVCGLPGVGLVFGIVALVQIKKRGERGKGMAVAGIVLSSISTVLVIVLLAVGGLTDVWDDVKNSVSGGTTFSVKKGECFDTLDGSLEGYAYDVDTVPCAGKHDAEVFANIQLPDGEFPGQDAVDEDADEKCFALSESYAMDQWALPAEADVYYYTPTRQSWRYGDREITCMFGNQDAESTLTGSLRKDETTLDDDQFAFLKADAILDAAFDGVPDVAYVEDDLPAHKKWAPDVVDALEKQTAALRAHDWEPGAEKEVTDYAGVLDKARDEWQAAADAKDAEAFSEHWVEAHKLTDGKKAVTARKALGLASAPQPDEAEETGEGGGGDGSRAEV